MKILVTSIIDLKKSQHNRPHQFVKYLSNNHDVTVISINDWWKGDQANLEAYSQEFADVFDRINYYYLTTKKVSPILQETLFVKKVSDVIKEGFDVHLNYSTLTSGYVASHYLKTVYDIADDLSAMIKESPQIPRFLRPLGGMLGDTIIRRNIQRSELVTVTAEPLIHSYNIPSNKYEIVPNGVDISLFKRDKYAKEELSLDGFIIGYVGVLREWVDFKPVFLALKELNPEVKILIVGKEGRFEETVKLANECGVSDRVMFTGMVSYSQVPLYVSSMDVCLIPFVKGGISENALPLKLFEYMACEKPVITTELLGIKKVADQYVMYASNSEEYRDKISQLYNNEKLRVSMGKAGKKFVEESYDWRSIAKRLENLLLDTKRKERNQ